MTLLRSCVLPVSLVLALGTHTIAQSVSDEDIDRILARADRGSIEATWGAAQELVELGDVVSGRLRQQLMKGSPRQRLAVSRALLELEQSSDARDGLLSVLLDSQVREAEIVVATAQLLSSPEFQEQPEVVQNLRNKLDDTFDPRVQLALATALYKISPADKRYAAERLEAWLHSDQRDLRVQGALALAEIGRLDRALPVLDEISNDPTAEGSLARAFLELNTLQRFLDRQLRQRRRSNISSDFEFLDEVLNTTLAYHIRGEDFEDSEGREELLAAAARGMLAYLDEHSTFFTSEQHERWIMELQRDYGGIGAYVDILNDIFTITRPIYSGPAYKAGLRSGDQVLEVDGWPTVGVTDIQEIISHLKGPAGTRVTVSIARRGWTKPREFELVRGTIIIPSLNYEMFPGDIGYVEVSTFGRQTPDELKNAISTLSDTGARALVLDLRFNSGGYLESAQRIVGLFCGRGKLVVTTKGRRPQDNQEYYANDEVKGLGEPSRLPMAVLINRYSASASEIVTGNLRFYDRADVVGEHSYGKGSVQTPLDLESRPPERFADSNGNRMYDQGEEFEDSNDNGKWDIGPFFKITTSRYFLPDGESIHREHDRDGKLKHRGGIKPDYPVSFREMDLWKEHELSKMLERTDQDGKSAFEQYLDEQYQGHRDTFVLLAEGDNRKWADYPGFDEFYEGLETRLSKEDIRFYLRAALRRRVSDDRGKTFPFPGNYVLGDYQEDNQLQSALKLVLGKLGERPADHREYRDFDSLELVRQEPDEEGSEPEDS